ncbi:MAG: hypothetical protein KAT05_03280, partial [Spirochaetes bacterium]|nr:hypothetical protein [Spirochaetota bacterium]
IGSSILLSEDVDKIDNLEFYKENLLLDRATTIIGNEINLSTRTLNNYFAKKIKGYSLDMEKKDISDIEKKIEFEKQNTGSLFLASKGLKVEFTDNNYSFKKVDDEYRKKNGNFMIGDVLYLYKNPFSIDELIKNITVKSKNVFDNSFELLKNYFKNKSFKFQNNPSFNVSKNELSCPKNDAIAIVGLGCTFPGSKNIKEYWEVIKEGKNQIIKVPEDRWDYKLYFSNSKKEENKSYCKIGGFITNFDFDPLLYKIPPAVVNSIDTPIKFAIYSTKQALDDYKRTDYDKKRVAVIIGSTMGGALMTKYLNGITVFETLNLLSKNKEFSKLNNSIKEKIFTDFKKELNSLYPKVCSDSITGILTNLSAGRIASIFDFRGSNYVVDAACASTLAAIDNGIKGLLSNEFDLVINGGTDSTMYPLNYVMFSKIYALSNDMSCPFDYRANGFVPGEGCGILILKRLSDAIRDKDEIYAVIRGIGSSCDGASGSIISPSVNGQALAIENAYYNAGYSPATIGLIECHGTSTAVGDIAEYKALRKVFDKYNLKKMSIPIGSVKSQIGHLKSASGAAGIIKAILSLYYKKIPASINYIKSKKELDFINSPFYVNTNYKEWEHKNITHPRRAGVSAFGFGGVNYHITLEEYNEEYHNNLIKNKNLDVVTSYETKIEKSNDIDENKKKDEKYNDFTKDKDWLLIKDQLLQILSMKTGYPVDMLKIDYNIV